MNNIYNKLYSIQKDFSIEKSQINKDNNYKFYRLTEMLEILKPLLLTSKTILTFESDMPSESYTRVTARLTDIEDTNQSIVASAIIKIGEVKNTMDLTQASGTAHTYGCKYALSSLLIVSDGIDSDSLNDNNTITKIEAPKYIAPPVAQVIEEAQNIAIIRLAKEKGLILLVEALDRIGIEADIPALVGSPAEIAHITVGALEELKEIVDVLTSKQMAKVIDFLKSTTGASAVVSQATSTPQPASVSSGRNYYPNIKDNYGCRPDGYKENITVADYIGIARPEAHKNAPKGKFYFFMMDKNFGLGLRYDTDLAVYYTDDNSKAMQLAQLGLVAMTPAQIDSYQVAKQSHTDYSFLNAETVLIKGITKVIQNFNK